MHNGIFMGVIHFNYLGQNLNNKSCILGLIKKFNNDLHINTTRNFGFCNCRLQLKFSCMRLMRLQICVVA